LLDLLSYPTRRSSDLDADVPGQSPDVGNGAKDPDGTRYGGGIGKDLVPAHPNIIATGSRHIAKGDHQGFLLLGQLHLPPDDLGYQGRSEEHTSELQSRENLVCRLLLEKKT